jgi:hypothetical protein
MERERSTPRPVEEVSTKAINVTVPLPLHREFREVAAREGLTGTALLRKLILHHLDRVKK